MVKNMFGDWRPIFSNGTTITQKRLGGHLNYLPIKFVISLRDQGKLVFFESSSSGYSSSSVSCFALYCRVVSCRFVCAYLRASPFNTANYSESS